ncbi:hypothetical protein CBM2606_P360004 [Cupriavidus taiwanensis]|uniref:Uncharacterized protein n=1 Tax=Cupriavidus neocaledonicus TaxID=1040979 RepID=A0ABY1VEM9_9BURK|nr:hypothetical protein CBM2605_P370004 [Cupriavidus neocaledonicus]SPA54308.1 hypothetical protein CBM2606_P360004 [Cupriavidus taiwanensis]
MPTPFGPISTTLAESLTNSSYINSSTAARSQRVGHVQSKSHNGLKLPRRASRMRRSSERRERSSSSHCSSGATHPASATSGQCASSPCRRKAFVRLCRFSGVFIGISSDLIVDVEPVGYDQLVLVPDVFRQMDAHRRGCMARFAPALQRQAHRILVRCRVAGEGFLDRRLQFGGAIPVEQPQQVGGDVAQIAAPFRRAQQQRLAGRRRPSQMVKSAMVAGFAFAFDQGVDVCGNFYLRAAIVTALMSGEQFRAIEDAYLPGTGPHRERASHMGMRDRVIIQAEAHVRCLADLDVLLRFARIGILRQGEQAGLLAAERLAYADRRFFPAGAIGRKSRTPMGGLSVELIEVGHGASGEEVLAHVADGALHAPFLVATGDGNRPGLVAVMRREREQRRMETDRISLAFQNGALQVVVEQDPGQAGPSLEGAGMAGQEAIHARIEEESQIDLPRPRQHHHEGHQRPARAADLQMAEVSPVNLPLFPLQGAQTQIGFGQWARPVQRDHVPEVVLAPAVATLGHHRIQAAGRERRELLQRLMDEWQVGVDLRGPLHRANPG